MKTVTHYECEFCGTKYKTSKEALACEALAVAEAKLSFKIGDIVLSKAGFGWYDGNRKWISNADRVDPERRGKPISKCLHNCFGACCTFQFYYVITHIDRDNSSYHRHAVRYHLVTARIHEMALHSKETTT